MKIKKYTLNPFFTTYVSILKSAKSILYLNPLNWSNLPNSISKDSPTDKF
jgi:hypothetical protein